MTKFDASRSTVYIKFLLCFYFGICVNFSVAQPLISFKPVITGLNTPMQIVNAGDGTNRIFIVQKAGTVLVYDKNYVFKSVFLTLSGLATEDEHGLLSMVFHPDYKTNGLFYVYYTNAVGNLVLERFNVSANPDVAAASSGVIVLTILHPTQPNHNGGELHFGSDGYLYLSTGDGGGSNDPYQNAQNTSALLGKMLRINVNTSVEPPYYTIPDTNPYVVDGKRNEVFAIGLRNPFRWSFDRQTNDMWIGDVGQGAREEVNHRKAGTTSGVNYGWPCYEGNLDHLLANCSGTAQYHFPVYWYQTSFETGRSVIGGVVYRGSAFPKMVGYYIGADHYTGDIHIIGPVDGSENAIVGTMQKSSFTYLSDFGETEDGELYAVGLSTNTLYLVQGADPLPVELVNFSGVKGVESVKLSWETSIEKKFGQFDVEFSTNAKSFEKVGYVLAKDAPNGAEYQFSHKRSGVGNLYYRLKMIDIDGTYKYSSIISITTVDSELSANFVRPSFIENKILNVVIEEPFSSLELVEVNGNILSKTDLTGKRGNIEIPLGSMQAGIYIVRMQGADKILNQKILVSQ